MRRKILVCPGCSRDFVAAVNANRSNTLCYDCNIRHADAPYTDRHRAENNLKKVVETVRRLWGDDVARDYELEHRGK